jgi:adenylate cyclase
MRRRRQTGLRCHHRTTLHGVSGYSGQEVADRAGVDLAFVTRLVERDIVTPDTQDRFSGGDVRRVRLAYALDRAGVPLDGIGAAIRSGAISLAFLDQPFYERFASLSGVTFRALAEETGIPIDLVMVVREAIGFGQPGPEDRVREDELRIVPVIKRLLETGSRPVVVERLLRVWGESLRRIAETEGEWWRSEVEAPLLASGMSEREMLEAANRLSPELAGLQERVVLEIYHAQHEHAATKNIVEDIESALAKAGVYSRLSRHPAVCFLDITGYTRLTEERGDEVAADLAGQLGRMVQRISMRRGGKPVKWLGDGVMLYFHDPGPAVDAALHMVRLVADAGLPSAHVGLHSGPVLFQEGDYFGRTVNVAARVADYARPGEVLATREIVDASSGAGVSFTPIGPVELKGVSGVVELYAAHGGM